MVSLHIIVILPDQEYSSCLVGGWCGVFEENTSMKNVVWSHVITDENGQRTIITGQEPFQNAATTAIHRRYLGATDAPINSGQLRQDLGTELLTAAKLFGRRCTQTHFQ